jgi:hypothetical protein
VEIEEIKEKVSIINPEMIDNMSDTYIMKHLSLIKTVSKFNQYVPLLILLSEKDTVGAEVKEQIHIIMEKFQKKTNSLEES